MAYNTHKNKKLTCLSKSLRKNMTKEERKLWYEFLQELPFTINRQKVFDNYIADFYCAEHNFIIEIDGSQHYDDENIIADKERDNYFNNLGIKVLRYTNRDIKTNFSGVCEDILANINMLSPR